MFPVKTNVPADISTPVVPVEAEKVNVYNSVVVLQESEMKSNVGYG